MGYEQDVHVRTELDSHADTCCFGSGAYVISEDTSYTVQVMGFLLGMRRKQETKIGMVAVAYDELKTFTTDTIYIKTQVFRLLRYYSPAPRNIARSDWATQNITHNMTSSKT